MDRTGVGGDLLYRRLYEYQTLEAAYMVAFDYLEDPIDDPEPWLINLQNELIWNTYQVGRDADEDIVVLEAIVATAKSMNFGPYDITGEARRILDELTLV